MSKRNLLISGVVLTTLASAAVYWFSRSAPAVTYREAIVERGEIALSILATGTVQPENRLEIKPPIAGRVERVLVKEGQKVTKGQILAWMSSTERAALLDAARSKGKEELERWEELYRPTPVIAPITGTIILRSIESGQTFTSTDPVLVMADRLTVKAQVDETDIAQVKLKQSALIVLDAYPEHKVPGKVDQIAFEAKTVNNVTTYEVEVLPDETPGFMRSGMTANVTFKVEERANVLVVPSEAIRVQGDAATLLVRGEDGKPFDRKVKLGLTDGKRTEIIEGAREGETILAAQVALRGKKERPTSPLSPMGRSSGKRGH